MEVKLRQRIIGAVVLVALAIIFLPLLFKNSTATSTSSDAKLLTLSAQIPPAPAKPAAAPQTIVMIKNKDLTTPDVNNTNATSNASSRIPTIQAGTALPNASVSTNDIKPTTETTQSSNPATTTKSINLVEDEALSPPGADKNTNNITSKSSSAHKQNIAAPTTKATHASVKPSKAVKNHEKVVEKKHVTAVNKHVITIHEATNKKTHHAKATSMESKPATSLHTKSSTTKTPAGAAWEVRLGSFANETNVKDLVKQLRAHGFKAYTQSIQSSVGTLTRVAIGPEIKRDKADAIQARLAKELNIKSSVVPFSPIPDNK